MHLVLLACSQRPDEYSFSLSRSTLMDPSPRSVCGSLQLRGAPMDIHPYIDTFQPAPSGLHKPPLTDALAIPSLVGFYPLARSPRDHATRPPFTCIIYPHRFSTSPLASCFPCRSARSFLAADAARPKRASVRTACVIRVTSSTAPSYMSRRAAYTLSQLRGALQKREGDLREHAWGWAQRGACLTSTVLGVCARCSMVHR